VRVPAGRDARSRASLWDAADGAAAAARAADALRDVAERAGRAAAAGRRPGARSLSFAAGYYQRARRRAGAGRAAAAAAPSSTARSWRAAWRGRASRHSARRRGRPPAAGAGGAPCRAAQPLTAEQAAALAQLARRPAAPVLLHGATGSGKTEVYLRARRAARWQRRPRRRWCWCPRST
jgi:primosomal protein N' (replication factor Y)